MRFSICEELDLLGSAFLSKDFFGKFFEGILPNLAFFLSTPVRQIISILNLITNVVYQVLRYFAKSARFVNVKISHPWRSEIVACQPKSFLIFVKNSRFCTFPAACPLLQEFSVNVSCCLISFLS